MTAVSYCKEYNAGGLHGVLWGKHYPAMVDPPIKLRVWGATDREVPFKEVILQENERSRGVHTTLHIRCVCVGDHAVGQSDKPTSSGWA